MMLEYLLRLALLLPLVGALAWASLWLWKRVQTGLPSAQPSDRVVQIVEILPVGAATRLAVVEFGGRQHLLAIARGTVTHIVSDERGEFGAA